ncbi:hypothetical protein EIP91_005186 [Steccherinum ochraceum]|uniref:DUF7918 domain-containing protein n=1 Tax=Steccherinum ochraceum TaxID=92696 RepID=A0A4V2MVU7_9APHY|nr:hypothetical protein EIP91_005186 [Steccherinum ochraceum]
MVGMAGVFMMLIDDQGMPFKEYATKKHSDGITTSCYISSRVGQSFSIEVDNAVPHDLRRARDSEYVNFRIFVDGIHVDSQLCAGRTKELVQGAPTSNGVQSRFVFSDLLTSTDESMAKRDWSTWDRFGLVEVLVHRVLPHFLYPPPATEPVFFNGLDTVHRENAYAGRHRTTLGEDVLQPNERCSVTYIDPKSAPYAALRVYYRPPEMLEARGIISGLSARTTYDQDSASISRDNGLPVKQEHIVHRMSRLTL